MKALSYRHLVVFWFIFFRCLFPRIQLITIWIWFAEWLCFELVTNHYQTQRWPCLLVHRCTNRPRWVDDKPRRWYVLNSVNVWHYYSTHITISHSSIFCDVLHPHNINQISEQWRVMILLTYVGLNLRVPGIPINWCYMFVGCCSMLNCWQQMQYSYYKYKQRSHTS